MTGTTLRFVSGFALIFGLALGCDAPVERETATGVDAAEDVALALTLDNAQRHLAPDAAGVQGDVLDAGFDITTEPGALPQLQLALEGERFDLPLEHTHIDVVITGGVAEVNIAQTYRNIFDAPIEAVYVFPLPENSAVNAMSMVIGARRIEAEIKGGIVVDLVVVLDRLHDLIADRVHRVQAGHWLLEDHRDAVSTKRAHLGLAHLGQVAPFETDSAADNLAWRLRD